MEQKGVYETTTRTHARTDVLYHLIVFITEITKRVCDTTAIVEDFWSWRNQSHSGQGSATQRNSITPKKVACKNVLVLGPVKTKFLFFFALKVFLSYLLANVVVFSDIIWAWITEERELSLNLYQRRQIKTLPALPYSYLHAKEFTSDICMHMFSNYHSEMSKSWAQPVLQLKLHPWSSNITILWNMTYGRFKLWTISAKTYQR